MADRFRKKDRSFKCKKCNNAYTSKQNLLTHFNSAHGEKIKFKCENCPKTFITCFKMRAHMKICEEIYL